MDPDEGRLDGNAVGGELGSVFGTDLLSAIGECGHCGATAALAAVHAYVRAPGMVLRCPRCSTVLLRLVRSATRSWVDLRGLRCIEIEH